MPIATIHGQDREESSAIPQVDRARAIEIADALSK
jgi:hypothetical protein